MSGKSRGGRGSGIIERVPRDVTQNLLRGRSPGDQRSVDRVGRGAERSRRLCGARNHDGIGEMARGRRGRVRLDQIGQGGVCARDSRANEWLSGCKK
jgi:hypothetical protein